MTSDQSKPQTIQLAKPPLVVQILAIIGFTGFAIPVSIIAMAEFGVLGLALAAFLGWQWTRLAGIGSSARLDAAIDLLKPQTPETPATSGNASFDAYRDTLMNRLEEEQQSFQGFLTRLRDAKDKTEFDTFLAEREQKARDVTNTIPA